MKLRKLKNNNKSIWGSTLNRAQLVLGVAYADTIFPQVFSAHFIS